MILMNLTGLTLRHIFCVANKENLHTTDCTCMCHGRVIYVCGGVAGRHWPQGSGVKRSHTSCRLQADPLLAEVLIVHIHHGCQRGLQPPESFTLNQMFHLARPRCRLDIKQSEWLRDEPVTRLQELQTTDFFFFCTAQSSLA